MGAHGSKEKLHRSASERFVHTQVIERERFGSFGKRVKKEGKKNKKSNVPVHPFGITFVLTRTQMFTPHILTFPCIMQFPCRSA
jgi:hypothetical protein